MLGPTMLRAFARALKAEEVGRKISSQEHGKGDVATQQTYGGYYALCHTDFTTMIFPYKKIDSCIRCCI